MKIPTKNTLKKYGLSEQEYREIWERQGGICPICGRSDALMVIDHEHIHNWRKLPAETRRLYVRGIICSYDNQRIVGRGATAQKLINGAHYLLQYQERRPK